MAVMQAAEIREETSFVFIIYLDISIDKKLLGRGGPEALVDRDFLMSGPDQH
jgi:hypothetical protein